MRAIVMAAWLGASTAGFAQPPQNSTPSNPLAGPRVEVKERKATLIARDFEGKLRRLEMTAEEAALDLIDLTEEERLACRKILDERAVILDRVVAGNLDLLVDVANASQAGDKAALLRLAGDVYKKLEPLRQRGTLQTELSNVLPEKKSVRLQELSREYRSAVRDEIVGEAKARGEKLRPAQGLARAGLAELGQEIRRSYERQIVEGTEKLESLVAKLGLSPEQDGKVRNMVTTFFQETKGKATPAEKRALFFRVMGVLDLQQKRELLKHAIQHG